MVISEKTPLILLQKLAPHTFVLNTNVCTILNPKIDALDF